MAKNLYQKVHNLLVEHAPKEARKWEKQFPTTGTTQPLPTQMDTINHYWRNVLGNRETDTIDARSCLIPYDDSGAWLKDFESHVVPAIKEK